MPKNGPGESQSTGRTADRGNDFQKATRQQTRRGPLLRRIAPPPGLGDLLPDLVVFEEDRKGMIELPTRFSRRANHEQRRL